VTRYHSRKFRWYRYCGLHSLFYVWEEYLLHYCAYIGGSSMWRVLACYFLGPLFTDWAPGCYVRCGCIGCPVFSFPVDGGRVGSVHLFFVACYCFLFWIGCVVSSSGSMKWHHLLFCRNSLSFAACVRV